MFASAGGVRRAWIFVLVVLIAGAATLVLWRPVDIQRLIERGTPRERYVVALERAGLGQTALVRDWRAAGDEALRNPASAGLPLTNEVRHTPSEPRAYGYRFELERGRHFQLHLTVRSDEPALIFIELFAQEDLAVPLAYTRGEEVDLGYEIRRTGAYVLRIQPELLRGGNLDIGQRTTASLTFPVSGRTSAAVKSFFRDPRDAGRRDHHGIDIFAPRDTPVLAAADGLVTQVGTSELGGNVVWVWNPARGQSHYYAHLSRQAVTEGSHVRAGDVVGYVGNTGNARTTPPHLHFAIYSRGEGPVDPLPFVRE